ncbi:glycosyltransferase [Antribacter sp. KLBMP9083]|uniref:Glycosyltransferase n=1 Tax=Antribacter soli TaxID=2910976 RepID=A0AA41QCX2_9MICO|nr:glycosyltransferase [Antribacter soli]MCF4119844.1 glycosyltransferase [Antribacter soli]
MTVDTRVEGRRGHGVHRLVVRVAVVFTVSFGLYYITWRWMDSVNWAAWWIAVPLVLAETYGLIDVSLFGLTMWRARRRGEPPAPIEGASVDVLITTYDEPPGLVRATARAARAIRHPHQTWILDDGDRPEMRAVAEELGVGYLTRGREWADRPRHAKAGNINNALMQTSGEFLVVLDADMVARPEFLDRTLGWFRDERVAFVQTPQVFSNVATGDPLGSQAPLFYGPIQEGKDGWNAAFFCGSNAVLRREALMQLGIVGYVQDTERSVALRLRDATAAVRRARRDHRADQALLPVLEKMLVALADARRALGNGEPLGDITYRLQRQVALADLRVGAGAVARVVAVVGARAGAGAGAGSAAAVVGRGPDDVGPRTGLEPDPDAGTDALNAVQLALRAIDVDRADEAQAILPLATISVTEDMATSMRLHALGLRSVFHNEVLADGLAPEDLGSMLTQRLRWAQGTMQLFLRENPLFARGMSPAQRLMYFSTMWSYLSGFATAVFIAAPVVFLVFGIAPVRSYGAEFMLHFVPFLAANQVLFLIGAGKTPTWRGQQYSFALFPVWIRACVSAFRNVVLHQPLTFAVTPKVRIHTNQPWRLVRWQLMAGVALAGCLLLALVRLSAGPQEFIPTAFNVVWVVFDLAALSVLIGAVRYRGYLAEEKN